MQQDEVCVEQVQAEQYNGPAHPFRLFLARSFASVSCSAGIAHPFWQETHGSGCVGQDPITSYLSPASRRHFARGCGVNRLA